MMEALHVTDGVAAELTAMARTPLEALSGLASELRGEQKLLSRVELLTLAKRHLDATDASGILNNLASLNLLRDDSTNSAESIFDALLKGCKAYGDEELALRLEERKDAIFELISSETLYLSVKSSMLFTTGSLHLHSMKIVSEVRPIFEPNRDDFPAIMIMSELHVVASTSSEKEERFSIALRAEELDEIIKECERAKGKLKRLEEFFSNPTQKRIVVYGRNQGVVSRKN